MAVMPLTNQRINVGQSITANQRFISGLKQKMSSADLIAGPDAVQKINDANLADAWNNFIVGYSQTGLPNTKTLRAITDVLGVDALAVGTISRVKEQDASFYVYPNVEISLKYTFFDKNGNVLWEANADSKKEGYASEPPVGEVLSEALNQIVSRLP